MKTFLLSFLFLVVGIAYADNTITSKEYIDTQVSNLQTQIPAKNANTVVTNTGTAGTIGEKAIYDTTVAYGTQSDALVTAGAFNTAVQNALESEFVCVEWQGNVHDNAHCLLYEVQNAYRPSKNLFDKNSPDIRWCWVHYDDALVGTRLFASSCVSSAGSFATSAPIPVEPNQTYTSSNHMPSNKGMNPSFVFLDENLNVISGFTNMGRSLVTFTVPNDVNIKYVVIPIHATVIDITQLEQGTVATPYVPYGNVYMPQN